MRVKNTFKHVYLEEKNLFLCCSTFFSIIVLAKELSTFETVCTQMLEDVQERLVYRTQVYIRNEILGYKPSPGDIAYPEKLEMMQVKSLF